MNDIMSHMSALYGMGKGSDGRRDFFSSYPIVFLLIYAPPLWWVLGGTTQISFKEYHIYDFSCQLLGGLSQLKRADLPKVTPLPWWRIWGPIGAGA